MIEIFAPMEYKWSPEPKLFLAGSIQTKNWRRDIVYLLRDRLVTIFNPVSKNWYSSWKQDKDFAPFSEIVHWGITAMEICDVIFMYFDPKTQSPISLLEFGLFAHTNKLIVLCPDGFLGKGSVDIICDRYNIIQIGSFEEFIPAFERKLWIMRK